jgi:plastocyanin
MRIPTIAFALLTALPFLAGSASGADLPEFRVVLKDHVFTPAEVEVPAGQKIRLIVENQDPTPEEFESYELNREKIVPANDTITVYVGPLEPGRYEFFGEFNIDTARGWLVAR